MRKYTQKELREYIRLKLARDLTTVDRKSCPAIMRKSVIVGEFTVLTADLCKIKIPGN